MIRSLRFALVALVAFALVHCHATPAAVAPPPASGMEVAALVAADAGTHPPAIALRYRGTNLSGAEFGTALPGEMGRDFQWPDPSTFEYFSAKGMNHVRMPFLHERMQPVLKGDLNADQWSELLYRVTYAAKLGMTVTLETHNSFRHKGTIVSETDIGDFWGRVATRLLAAHATNVMINVTNEPHDMPTETVVKLNNAAIRELRRVGFAGYILVPGNGWTGGGHWTETWYGASNAAIMNQVGVGDAKVVYEVHQYLDADASGAGKECVSADIGVQRLAGFVAALRKDHRQGFLGEIAAPNTPTCAEAVKRTLASLEADYDVWLGWDWWGAGEWSFATTYPLSIGPANPSKPQLAWLLPFLPCGARP